jgi:hypothetical protein
MKTHGFSDTHHINHHFPNGKPWILPIKTIIFPIKTMIFPIKTMIFPMKITIFQGSTNPNQQGSHQGYPTSHLHHLASTLPFSRSDGARSIHQQHPLRQDGLAKCHGAWLFLGDIMYTMYIMYV